LAVGGLPWISLALAASFGAYGLLRKIAPMPPLVSLFAETALLAPVALGYLAWLEHSDTATGPGAGGAIQALLMLAGVVTALPLVWFASAAHRLRLITLGLFQYLAPSGHFLLAVVLYGEPVGPPQVRAFLCIWAGLLLYSWDGVRTARAAMAGSPAGPEHG
jgi:chloramphenicol-sensitive protein RarD